MKIKNFVIAIAIALAVAFAAYGVGYAITSMYKQLVGIGNTSFNREVDVNNVQVAGPTKVITTLESTTSTVADYVYTVTLFLDSTSTTSSTISFTLAQIPNTQKKITFSGLSLGSVSDIGVEVTK